MSNANEKVSREKDTEVTQDYILLDNGMRVLSVTVGTSIKINMGNYQSFGEDMRITISGNEQHTLDQVVDYATQYIDERLEEIVIKTKQNFEKAYSRK